MPMFRGLRMPGLDARDSGLQGRKQFASLIGFSKCTSRKRLPESGLRFGLPAPLGVDKTQVIQQHRRLIPPREPFDGLSGQIEFLPRPVNPGKGVGEIRILRIEGYSFFGPAERHVQIRSMVCRQPCQIVPCIRKVRIDSHSGMEGAFGIRNAICSQMDQSDFEIHHTRFGLQFQRLRVIGDRAGAVSFSLKCITPRNPCLGEFGVDLYCRAQGFNRFAAFTGRSVSETK